MRYVPLQQSALRWKGLRDKSWAIIGAWCCPQQRAELEGPNSQYKNRFKTVVTPGLILHIAMLRLPWTLSLGEDPGRFGGSHTRTEWC